MLFKHCLFATPFFLFLAFHVAFADELLVDRDGDGTVVVLAFGDSITAGVGDSAEPGEVVFISAPALQGGYPAIVQELLSVPVLNRGRPGEVFTAGGLERLMDELQRSSFDVLLLFEGANDALFRTPTGRYSLALQKGINAARALGKKILLFSLPPSCCTRIEQRSFIRSLNEGVRSRVNANSDVVLVDLERAFDFLCPTQSSCYLLNEPEGLHPNSTGYRVIAELVLATLLEIDLFSPGGAEELEQALDLEPGSVTPLVAPVEGEEA